MPALPVLTKKKEEQVAEVDYDEEACVQLWGSIAEDGSHTLPEGGYRMVVMRWIDLVKLRPCPSRYGLGALLALLNADQSLEVARSLLQQAGIRGRTAKIWAFSFDDPRLLQIMENVAAIGGVVKLVMDVGYFSPDLERLGAIPNIEVRGAVGRVIDTAYAAVGRTLHDFAKGKEGRHHAKGMMVGPHLLLGSANWSTAMTSNHELDAFQYLNPSGARVAERCFSTAWEQGTEIRAFQALARQRAASGSRSAGPRRAGYT